MRSRTAVAYGKRLGKTVIVVQRRAGLLRQPHPRAVHERGGLAARRGRRADRGASTRRSSRWGFPVGPVHAARRGRDRRRRRRRARSSAEAFGARMAPAPALRRVLESGRTGRKGGQGFYRVRRRRQARRGVDASVYPHRRRRRRAAAGAACRRRARGSDRGRDRASAPSSRCSTRRCAASRTACCASPRDGDVGAVFGIGFPPFRGGPFRTLDAIGADVVVRAMATLAARFGGGRFTSSAALREAATAGRRFHPLDAAVTWRVIRRRDAVTRPGGGSSGMCRSRRTVRPLRCLRKGRGGPSPPNARVTGSDGASISPRHTLLDDVHGRAGDGSARTGVYRSWR